MNRRFRNCIVIAIAIAIAIGLSMTVSAEPPRWIVEDDDSTMVLFPTIHLLPAELEWRSPALEESLSSADEVWFEIHPDAQDPAAMQRLVAEHGLDAATPLEERVGAELHRRTVEAANRLGLPMAQLRPLRPWLLAITLTAVELGRAGFEPDAGAESALQAMLDGQRVRALETPESQMRLLAGLPEPRQLALLENTLDEIDEGVERFRELAEDWARGDIDGLESMLIDELKNDYPDVYEVLFTTRNRDWVRQLEAELAGSGSDFVAVGAGHLVGEDSVVAMLRERGWRVQRIGSSSTESAP